MIIKERNRMNGLWEGKMISSLDSVNISLFIDNDKSYFNCDEILVNCQELENLKFVEDKIQFIIQPGDTELKFIGTINGNNISGKIHFENLPSNLKVEFELNKSTEKSCCEGCSFEEISILNNGYNLFSQILKPEESKKCPALLMLHGSHSNLGSQYISEAKIYKELGFLVLVFDKRGNGRSTGNYKAATFNDLIDDAIACLEYLESRNDVDKDRIGIWGFSQGASILSMISNKSKIPSFVIAKSPEIVSLTESAVYQDSIRIKEKGFTEMDCEVVSQAHKNVEKLIHNGADNNEVEAYINNNAEKYSFMDETALFSNIKISEEEFNSWVWKGRTVRFDMFWRNINIPALVFWGSEDILVNPIENKNKLNSYNLKNVEIKIFKDGNHNLMFTSENKNDGILWPRLVKGYESFIKEWLLNKNII